MESQAPPPQNTYVQEPAPAQVQGQTYAPPPAGTTRPAPPPDDINDWINRVKVVLDKPETLTAPAPAGAQPWHYRFIEFFDPIDTCLITWCCPCITFGKTHHRLRKDANLKDYSPVNPTCLGFWVSAICCLHIPALMMQRHDIRDQNHLQGDCAGDCLRAWCCPWCDLVQQDKEAEFQLLQRSRSVHSDQPQMKPEMQLPA